MYECTNEIYKRTGYPYDKYRNIWKYCFILLKMERRKNKPEETQNFHINIDGVIEIRLMADTLGIQYSAMQCNTNTNTYNRNCNNRTHSK